MEYKPLPTNDQLEVSILAGLIFSVSDVDKAHDYIDMINDDMFINPTNKTIFKEIKNSVFNDKLIGPPKTLAGMGIDAIEYFVGVKAMEFHLEKSIEDLKEVTLRREIIIKSRELEGIAYEQDIHRNDLIENFNNAANEISGLKTVNKPTTLNVIKSAVQRVKDAFKGDNGERVMYCHEAIDSSIAIFRKQVHTFGADQGGGKTALALDCMRRQAKSGMNVVYFCTESASDELLLRMIGSELKIDMQSLLTGDGMTDSVMANFQEAIKIFKKQHENFWIIGLDEWDCTCSNANSILSKIMREHERVDMVYWDFLQDILPPRTNKNADIMETIRINVSEIKQITERHNVASTILSQFRKERANRKPVKQDFWGASAIINASHIMSCLYTESEDDENQAPPEVMPIWWYSVKTRLIKQWSVKLMFKGAHGIFTKGTSDRFTESDRPNNQYHNKGAGYDR